MKAVDFKDFGEAEVLQLVEVPEPEVRDHDLLVRVHAAGVNRADIIHRRGGYGRPNFGDSEIMGLEIAGEVIAVGSDVHGFGIGDRIMGITGGGAYAEVARLDYRMALPIPGDLDYVRAAAIPEVFVTAHEALVHLGRLKYRHSVLIHAGAGGVGSAAIQLARAIGARVFSTSDAKKLAHLQKFGASRGIDYRTEDFVDVIKEETNGHGVDVIVDFIGAPYLERNVRCLADGGRLIQVGILGGTEGARLPLDRVLHGHLQIIGTVMKSRPQAVKHQMVSRFAACWSRHFEEGTLSPVIDSVFPLAQAADAHRRMESTLNVGKIVLTT
ncbi:NAD(P)H-quinone oxidoreductase [Paraburkholderia sp. ZP32-5]|uniref:NAD(P)H-quinone oxidoreductase n=1 Tax=Paraburkholderia sp. ZP32-5 TaxID=2883245 RepID=UPI001F341163|nr:NAD(P)H-quinone oxidoreductase [Paraburkholderia sp. ZP32-5]